jgi:hypothetical protein
VPGTRLALEEVTAPDREEDILRSIDTPRAPRTSTRLRRPTPESASATAHAAPAWRCGWCRRDRTGVRRTPPAIETTGICENCLGVMRSVGSVQRGPGFLVWDEDARAAAAWADELRAAARSHRHSTSPASGLVP